MELLKAKVKGAMVIHFDEEIYVTEEEYGLLEDSFEFDDLFGILSKKIDIKNLEPDYLDLEWLELIEE